MNILFVTANRVGDTVLSTGVLDYLIQKNPNARVWVACGELPAPLFAATPSVERVIVLTKRRFARHWFELWRATVGRWWDIVVDLRSWGLAWSIPARRRFVLNKRSDDCHRIRLFASALALDPPPPPRVHASDGHRRRARALIPQGRPLLALGATANWGGKRWPAERFAALAARMTAPSGLLADASVAVIGAESERGDVTALLDSIPRERRVDLVGTVDLPTIYACCEQASIFIGNDSGVMHLAAAAGVPTLGLFGPSREDLYAPWGPHTATVRTPESYESIVSAPYYDYRSQETHMASLAVETVEAGARELLARQRAQP